MAAAVAAAAPEFGLASGRPVAEAVAVERPGAPAAVVERSVAVGPTVEEVESFDREAL